MYLIAQLPILYEYALIYLQLVRMLRDTLLLSAVNSIKYYIPAVLSYCYICSYYSVLGFLTNSCIAFIDLGFYPVLPINRCRLYY